MDPRTFGILGVDLRNRFVDLHGVVKSPASSYEKSARCGCRLEQPRSCRSLLAPAPSTKKEEDGSAADPTDAELNIWLNDAVRMKQIRQRLSDISWWMLGNVQGKEPRADGLAR